MTRTTVPPDSKLTRSKQRWAQEGKFLTGKISRPEEQRLPPGQHLTRDWPVLDLGLTPIFRGSAGGSMSMAPSKIRSSGPLPNSRPSRRRSLFPTSTASPHGRATTTSGKASPTRDLLMACQPRDEARFVVLHSHDGYTTNLSLEDFAAEDALLAHSWSGQPLEQDHGGPVRLVVPHLYFWKSAKWLQSIEFLARGRARLLGSPRLSQPRRSLEGRAVFGGLECAASSFETALRASSG